jgi:hypothetical protein
MAYDLEDGDPLRSWSPYDFNLGDRDGDIEIEQDGASIVELRGNQMLIEARDPGFRVACLGSIRTVIWRYGSTGDGRARREAPDQQHRPAPDRAAACRDQAAQTSG